MGMLSSIVYLASTNNNDKQNLQSKLNTTILDTTNWKQPKLQRQEVSDD